MGVRGALPSARARAKDSVGVVCRQRWSLRERKRLRAAGVPGPENWVCPPWGVWTRGAAAAVSRMRVSGQEGLGLSSRETRSARIRSSLRRPWPCIPHLTDLRRVAEVWPTPLAGQWKCRPLLSWPLSSSLAHPSRPMPPSGVSLPELGGAGLELGGRVPGVIPHEKGRGACLGM